MGEVYAEKLTILLVDPQSGGEEKLRSFLGEARLYRAELIVADSLDEAQGLLHALDVDLMILNGSVDSDVVLAALDERLPARLEVPVIVLTRKSEDRLALKAVAAGAQDYLVLDTLDADTLNRSVRYAVERHQLVADLKELSLYDELTGLHNRRAFFALARQQLKLAERTYARMLVFFADLDNLKYVNDTYGHQEGDRLLKRTAQVMRATFRDSDIVARLGGDEFSVLAAEIHKRGADRALMRLRRNIEVHNANPAHRIEIALSVGVAYYDPTKPRTLEELISRADRLMYAEKKRKKIKAAQERATSGTDPDAAPL